MDPTVVALLGTLMGGVGLKVVEWWLSKGKVKIDDATQIRNELRAEVTALRAENKILEDEVDTWKAKYYELIEKTLTLETDLKILHSKVDSMIENQ